MSKAINAADELQRLATMFQGVQQASDTLREVGKLDVAIDSRKAHLQKLDDEIAQRKKQGDMAVEQSKKQRETAERTLSQATMDAERMISEANDTASRIAAQARQAADDVEAEREKAQAASLKEYQAKLKALDTRERKLIDSIASQQEKLDKLAEQETAMQTKLQDAKARIADLIKD